MKAPIPLEPDTSTVAKLRGALVRRGRIDVPRVDSAELPQCDSARRFWSERAWSEFAAVPAMSQTILAMVREGSSIDAMASVSNIQSDEMLHTELSRDLADGLGGYISDIPDEIPYEPRILGEPNDAPLAFWLVGSGCISEHVSMELMRARLKYAEHPLVHKVLDRVFRDEAVHCRVGWQLAEQVLPKLDQTARHELADYAMAMFEAIGSTFVTCGLPESLRREARAIRQVTYDRRLGACPPDEADHICADTIRSQIMPRFRRLGLPL